MKALGLVAACAALAGCVSTGGKLNYDAELTGYTGCIRTSARLVARQEGDPMSLAYAARGMCASEENAILQTLLAQTTASRTKVVIDTFRRLALESAAADIAKIRAGAQ